MSDRDPALPVDPDVAGESAARRPAALAAVAGGGALGAPARYEVGRLIQVHAGGFPWATFGINVTGSLALGFLLVLLLERFPPSHYLRAFAATGFLGAYTTFSTYMVDAATLTKDGHAAVAAAYVVASLAAGLLATVAGLAAGRRIVTGS